MDATLLGSGGWIPTSRRQTCCAYLRHRDYVLLIDAGTGVQRLLEEPRLLAGVERLDIVLTHFHLDHVIGLSYLPALPVAPTLWGPGELLTGAPTAAILGRLFGSPLFAADVGDLTNAIYEIQVEPCELGPFQVSTRIQRLHTDATLAIRIGDEVTYCTDTAADPGNVPSAEGTSLLCTRRGTPRRRQMTRPTLRQERRQSSRGRPASTASC